MRKKILPAAFVCLVVGVAFTVCFLEATTKKEERKDADRKNQAVFINTARSALEKMNVPVADRRSSVEYAGNEVIVTFHPKEGERAGSFIVRIDRKTGEIRDTKIWR